ncbi:MAG: RNA-binding transcriptional accessory protein [Spirochaetaceae bacterium]|nr:RNA-binding transcriptional accessory protein [Spirochaetaceae bacterium]
MEFTQEQIDALVVNEVSIMKRIAEELNIRVQQVSAVISLVNEGCTIPFISRYRKEAHGSLDEVQVRDSDHLFKSYTNLETRRIEIIKGVFAQNKLTESLYEAVKNAKTLTELEDLWAPFKKKKKTRGMVAIEKGLDPLADAMLELDDAAIQTKAAEFVCENAETPELSVASVSEALSGAQDILAERTSQDSDNRSDVRGFYMRTGKIVVKGIGSDEDAKTSVYQMYWDYEEALNQIKPHRILAINRGEREGKLEVSLNVDVDGAIDVLKRKQVINNKYHAEAIEDGLVRLLSPAVLREIRGDQTDEADDHGIGIFSENLKNLLMQQPIKGTRVLGVDPGIRTGTKCAALDETGKFLGDFVIKQVVDPDGAAAAIRKAIMQYNIQLVAVGNGTGTKEVQEIVAKVISENFPEVLYTVVDEDGASVYSASDTAREEFPDLDLTIRGAISIGRRLQDPLAELVKIDPKSIGVGLYQHDVNQKKLSEMLDEVVGSVVNNVGVNLNTASYSLLKYVSGINTSLAKKIVAYRNEHGKITSRQELMKVGGMGEKTFEQCAGFLKIPESSDPLDNTWVHPENYEAAREVLPLVQKKAEVSATLKKELKEKYNLGDQTVIDIIEELQKPNRDPHDGYPKPIMQKGVVTFEDLKEGMKVTGKIKNVVDFGAFVDLGIKETALLHISELSDTFVSDPMEVLKVGDIKECTIIGLDLDRRRISLSLKSNPSITKSSGSEPKKVVKVVRKSEPAKPRNFDRKPSESSDGMSYNPFAALLKDKK